MFLCYCFLTDINKVLDTQNKPRDVRPREDYIQNIYKQSEVFARYLIHGPNNLLLTKYDWLQFAAHRIWKNHSGNYIKACLADEYWTENGILKQAEIKEVESEIRTQMKL